MLHFLKSPRNRLSNLTFNVKSDVIYPREILRDFNIFIPAYNEKSQECYAHLKKCFRGNRK